MTTPISPRIGENCFNSGRGNPASAGEAVTGSGSVRALLRQATTTLHDALDARVTALLAGGERDYVAFLRGSAAAVFSLEGALEAAQVAAILPDWDRRSRRQALRLDLADFDEPFVPTPSATIGSDAASFGILYVLEGSRLGARSLAHRMSRHPSERVRTATRYLNHGLGQRLWPSFLDRLETAQPVRDAPHDAISGARSAFATFATAYSVAA